MGLRSHFQALAVGVLLITTGAVSYAQPIAQTTSPIDSETDSANDDLAENTALSDDPWEGYNRAMFAFNDGIDHYAFKPLAKGYRAVMPDPVESGVSNVYDNLLEIRNVINDVLQWKWKQAANDSGRFVVNSTVGIVGVFDVAKHAGLPKNTGEDFGQTAAKWGTGQGNFVMLPFFGPSTVRDTFTLPLDLMASPIGYLNHVPTRNTLTGFQLLTDRANLLQAEALISGDRYAFIRDAYLQRREYLIEDGEVEDSFSADLEDDEFSEFGEF